MKEIKFNLEGVGDFEYQTLEELRTSLQIEDIESDYPNESTVKDEIKNCKKELKDIISEADYLTGIDYEGISDSAKFNINATVENIKKSAEEVESEVNYLETRIETYQKIISRYESVVKDLLREYEEWDEGVEKLRDQLEGCELVKITKFFEPYRKILNRNK